MDDEAVLSIDFGSAYTKIAVRTGWNSDSALIQDLSLAPRDSAFCIPSVVARVASTKGEKWLIGVDAASQLPGPDVTIYSNWKASLFGVLGLESHKDGATGGTKTDITEVATQFFRRLRDGLLRRRGDYDVADLPVRICIPKLADGDGAQALIAGILRNCGWESSIRRPSVSEPESNALGVLSRGRNATWIPPYFDFTPHWGRSAKLPDMLEPSLSRAFREGVMRETRSYYGVLVTDIGAFTTDFGYVRFDSSFWTADWQTPQITAQSCKLGIRELDSTVLQQLPSEAQQAVAQLPSAEWDRYKTMLYHGEPVALRRRQGGVLMLGQGKEARAIQEAVHSFAGKVWQSRKDFAESELSDSVHAEALTGGGAMIPLIRETLVKQMQSEGRMVHDLLDKDEPRNALGAVTERALEQRARQNQELVRGGSAIGGCSVFFASK